jgi:23S rRNA (cytosine1962-C5)-methyltransferase
MILRELADAFVLDKPAGVSTHTPDGGLTPGFLEMASKLLDRPLWAVHRLDTGTSGCLLVTTTAANVDEWTHKLAKGRKKYVFISRNLSHDAVWSQEGRIEKIASHQFGLVKGEINSKTTFAKLGHNSLGVLYEAEISTGRTHQIRIHAEASGIPILGDTEHGGPKFLRLMLHSRELEIDGTKITSPLPKIFAAKQDELHFDDYAKFLVSFDRRRFLKNFYGDETTALRLVHREWATQRGPKLAAEKLGEVLQLLNYFGREPDREFVEKLATIAECKHWFIRQMHDRGRTVNSDTIIASQELPLQWKVKENGVNFDLRYNQGLSSGLFLDQRENRNKVRESSQGKRIANFFSYTCGFSVVAALGGAHEVVSIDTSSTSLEWGKNNFKINGLEPDRFEFFSADALFFLKSCIKRDRHFDLIILDPPTFSRGKHGIFKINENLPELLELAFKCLDQRGALLATINDETITSENLSQIIEQAAQKTKFSPLRMEKAQAPYDFEFPLERNTVMKGFWITKLL